MTEHHRPAMSEIAGAIGYRNLIVSQEWDNCAKLVDEVEPIDVGPNHPGDCLVAVAKHEDEPLWSLYVLSHKVGKQLRFSHRYLDRVSTTQLCATLNTGIFYSEQGQASDWTPDTYASVLGNGVLYNYIVEMMMPADWKHDPPVRQRVRLWPIHDYEPEIPEGFRIARGNRLVLAFAESVRREEMISALTEGNYETLRELDELGHDDKEQ